MRGSLSFSAGITIGGTPTIGITLDGVRRYAPYAAYIGTTGARFAHPRRPITTLRSRLRPPGRAPHHAATNRRPSRFRVHACRLDFVRCRFACGPLDGSPARNHEHPKKSPSHPESEASPPAGGTVLTMNGAGTITRVFGMRATPVWLRRRCLRKRRCGSIGLIPGRHLPAVPLK